MLRVRSTNCFPSLCVCIFVILNFCEISPIKLAHSNLYNDNVQCLILFRFSDSNKICLNTSTPDTNTIMVL